MGTIRKGRGRDLLAKTANGKPRRPSPESAKNGKPRKVYLTTRNRASLAVLNNPLDLRSALGKRYVSDVISLKSHVGGDPSVIECRLIDQASRLALLMDLAWGEVLASETLVKDNTPVAAIDIFLKCARDHRQVLGLIGVDRRARDITLQDVLEARDTGNAPV
jgi:hypothetical protein